MSVTESPGFGIPTSDIAIPPGHIVYVEEMVAESVAFRAGRTVGPPESDSVRPRRFSSPEGRLDRLPPVTGAE
jgi:hypothetical protein